jgi:hypothetical protein
MTRHLGTEKRIEAQTRAMFARVLSAWAMDLLELRRTGLIVPSARAGAPDPVMPVWSNQDNSLALRDTCWPTPAIAGRLQWRPARRAA